MEFVGGVGYTNIDLIYADMARLPATGEEVFAKKFEMHLGGGVPATLINTTRLGVPSKILTFLGDDFFSGFAAKSFEQYGAQVINLYRGTGMPIVLTSVMVCNEDRSFASYRDESTAAHFAEEEIYRNLTGAKLVDMHVGFLDVYKQLKKEGSTLVFDTGWEDDLSVRKYEAYLELADYYLPNQKEALKITGAETVEQAADCLSAYFPAVVIKLDKDGCLLKDKDGLRCIPPLPGVKAVDATGGGDAFMSGFLYGLFHNQPVEACVRYGNVMGGTCVQGIGCLTKYVDEKELLELAETIPIRMAAGVTG